MSEQKSSLSMLAARIKQGPDDFWRGVLLGFVVGFGIGTAWVLLAVILLVRYR